MKVRTVLMILAMAGFVLSSCEYEWIEPEKVPIPDTVSFSNDVMPIFNNGCNTNVCHGPGATSPDLSEGNAYNALVNGGYVDTETPEASTIYTCMINGGSMTSYVQSASDPEIILAWIEQGAENN